MSAVQNAGETILDVSGLKTYFYTRAGIVKAVEDLNFTLNRGETLAIVGESGCGKSMTALSLMRLIPEPPGRIVGGTVVLEGQDLLAIDDESMRQVRGNE
ncbi:MAG: ATP-binding cassette domain-containing protein, partial [Quisquiliibacterium sp.]